MAASTRKSNLILKYIKSLGFRFHRSKFDQLSAQTYIKNYFLTHNQFNNYTLKLMADATTAIISRLTLFLLASSRVLLCLMRKGTKAICKIPYVFQCIYWHGPFSLYWFPFPTLFLELSVLNFSI